VIALFSPVTRLRNATAALMPRPFNQAIAPSLSGPRSTMRTGLIFTGSALIPYSARMRSAATRAFVSPVARISRSITSPPAPQPKHLKSCSLTRM
jgi:hypothetical protein